MSGDTHDGLESWRCRGCGALLGVVRDGALEIRSKGAVYWTSGMTRARCPRCGTTNVHSPHAGDSTTR